MVLLEHLEEKKKIFCSFILFVVNFRAYSNGTLLYQWCNSFDLRQCCIITCIAPSQFIATRLSDTPEFDVMRRGVELVCMQHTFVRHHSHAVQPCGMVPVPVTGVSAPATIIIIPHPPPYVLLCKHRPQQCVVLTWTCYCAYVFSATSDAAATDVLRSIKFTSYVCHELITYSLFLATNNGAAGRRWSTQPQWLQFCVVCQRSGITI